MGHVVAFQACQAEILHNGPRRIGGRLGLFFVPVLDALELLAPLLGGLLGRAELGDVGQPPLGGLGAEHVAGVPPPCVLRSGGDEVRGAIHEVEEVVELAAVVEQPLDRCHAGAGSPRGSCSLRGPPAHVLEHDPGALGAGLPRVVVGLRPP